MVWKLDWNEVNCRNYHIFFQGSDVLPPSNARFENADRWKLSSYRQVSGWVEYLNNMDRPSGRMLNTYMYMVCIFMYWYWIEYWVSSWIYTMVPSYRLPLPASSLKSFHQELWKNCGYPSIIQWCCDSKHPTPTHNLNIFPNSRVSCSLYNHYTYIYHYCYY